VFPTNLGVKEPKISNGETVEVLAGLFKGKIEFRVSNITKETISWNILKESNK
jgi:hypothetical protein